jgi:hypothetical protein
MEISADGGVSDGDDRSIEHHHHEPRDDCDKDRPRLALAGSATAVDSDLVWVDIFPPSGRLIPQTMNTVHDELELVKAL